MKIPFQVKAYGALALFAAVVIAKLWWDDRQVPPPAPPPPPVDMSSMSLAQTIAHCRALWAQQYGDRAPLAIAWHAQGLDWYMQSGVDTTSMRRISCTGQGVAGGARFERVLRERAPPGGGPLQSELMQRNLFDYYANLPTAGAAFVALEAVQDPQGPITAAPIERRWGADGGVQTPLLTFAPLANFPILLSQLPANLAASDYPALQAVKAHRWLEQPDAVFALLEKELPPNARIAQASFDNFAIAVTIHGSFGNAEGRPNSPYGHASFDETGVRDFESFHPREISVDSCVPGHSVSELKVLYAKRMYGDRPNPQKAQFGCDGNARQSGGWYITAPKYRTR